MKEGDIIQHKKYKWIGKIIRDYCITWEVERGRFTEVAEASLYRVKFFDVSKKYTGVYAGDEIEPYNPTTTTDDTISDWLSTPKERLRKALARKQAKDATNWQKTRKIRCDGRNSR